MIENAKRRLVAQLLGLGLPVESRVSENTERGVMFDFLRSPEKGPRVLTGHATGLITLNVEEADDAKREKIRQDLHEPYRTLLEQHLDVRGIAAPCEPAEFGKAGVLGRNERRLGRAQRARSTRPSSRVPRHGDR